MVVELKPDLVSRILLATSESHLEREQPATKLYELSMGEGHFPKVSEEVKEHYKVFMGRSLDLDKTGTGYGQSDSVEEHDAKLDGVVFAGGNDPRNPFVLMDFYPKFIKRLTEWLEKQDNETSFVIIRPSDIEFFLSTPDEQASGGKIVVEYQGNATIYLAGRTS